MSFEKLFKILKSKTDIPLFETLFDYLKFGGNCLDYSEFENHTSIDLLKLNLSFRQRNSLNKFLEIEINKFNKSQEKKIVIKNYYTNEDWFLSDTPKGEKYVNEKRIDSTLPMKIL